MCTLRYETEGALQSVFAGGCRVQLFAVCIYLPVHAVSRCVSFCGCIRLCPCSLLYVYVCACAFACACACACACVLVASAVNAQSEIIELRATPPM